jgi:cell division septation protein DedD
MRNLFFVLVLANLAFAAWHAWFSPAAISHRDRDGDAPTIMLASEFPLAEGEPATPAIVEAELEPLDAAAPPGPGDETADSRAQVDATAADGERACVSVGPFRELSQAATAAANLRGAGFDPVQRAGEGDIWVGYWVYLAAIPSLADAETILARLKENGITEAYVIPSSDSGTLISLGVFTEVARAGSRLSAARELGYEATISDRTRRGTVYWVDVLLAPGETLDFDALQPPGRIVRLEQRPCADTLQ